MTTKKMALLRLNAHAVRQLLQLPDDTEVVRVETEPGYRSGGVHIVVEGVGWDTAEGYPIFPTFATVHEKVDAEGFRSQKIDWGFPE